MFVTAESLCSARPVCRLFPKCCSASSWPSRAGSTSSRVTSLTLSRKSIASSESSAVLAGFPVLVLMHLASRRGQIAGISAEPDGPGVPQLMRHAPDAEDGCLRHIRVLIHARDPLFRPAGRDPFPPADVIPIRCPARAPTLNAYTERFVRTIKDSCLERLVLIGEGSRRRVGREFVAHYHHKRNHQGLDHRLILPLSTATPRGRVPCRQRLGGMLHYDYRSAA